MEVASKSSTARLALIRLTVARRLAGKAIKPRASSFSNRLRAAMSLSSPAPLRQFHRSHSTRDNRHLLQAGWPASKERTDSRSEPDNDRPFTDKTPSKPRRMKER